jgi:O-antigen/teichoic acid export membrane protein
MVGLFKRLLPDLGAVALLCLLPLLFFAPVTLGGRTLLPADNLYQYEPWASYRAAQGVPAVPHNALLSDLIFQNWQWKQFLRESWRDGDIPLWQAHQFSGTPFLANGQHSAYYPFSLIYVLLPLWLAYGWFTVSQLALAGLWMYALGRGLDLERGPALIAGTAYQLSGFFIAGTVHPMIQATAAWLPLLILMAEWCIHPPARLHDPQAPFLSRLPTALIGGIGLGLCFLAGHIEITYYTLLILALYAGLRLLSGLNLAAIGALLLMVGLGFGLGAVQFIPLLETANSSFRTERSSLAQVRSYALPPRHLALWLVPNVYGNPAHQHYFDPFRAEVRAHEWERIEADGRLTRISNTDFGIKNYVEGAVYVGIFPLLLAGLGLLSVIRARLGPPLALSLIGLLAVLWMFGTPAYAPLYYLLPGLDQLHTPFRWAWALTFVLCLLAGYGAQSLSTGGYKQLWRGPYLAGLVLAGALLLSVIAYDSLTAPLAERLWSGLAGANLAFPDAEAFYSYQVGNLAALALALIGSGGVWFLMARARSPWVWTLAALALIWLDMFLAMGTFNPRARREWLDFKPPALTWLQEQQAASLAAGEGGFRLQAYDWGEHPLIANMGWGYGLYDVRGYDSLFSKQYADYLAGAGPQTGLAFNRIQPIPYDRPGDLLAPQWDQLGVRYLLTDWLIHEEGDWGIGPLADADYRLAYETEGLRIYENTAAFPMVYALPGPDLPANLPLEREQLIPGRVIEAESSQVWTEIRLGEAGWLILNGTYAPGWRAYARPLGAAEDQEQELSVERVGGNFRGVSLGAGDWAVRWRYNPVSFQLGAFASFISGMLLIFLAMLWAWARFVGERADSDAGRRIIKNSLAPILLNLFNRGIDFAFAFVMLRILAPEGAGIYYYAIVVFGWFDILTNFGLNTLLTREVARDPSQARHYLLHTSLLRLILAGLGVLGLGAFLLARNTFVTPPLTETALFSILLLYLGLLPNSISTGLTALFYAFEKAEYPAALSTVSTLFKVSLGLGALLLGWGPVGLAGVSILTNLLTLGLMLRLAGPLLAKIQPSGPGKVSPALMRGLAWEAYPLMLNHFLATIFFKSDIILMEAINGAAVVGVYSTAYKWLDALNIIPAFFTMALLPLMSRQAQEDKVGLGANYQFGYKALVMIAAPVAVLTSFAAPGLIGFLGGPEFLPDGGIALQIMIWSILIGWINSLTQYVLIALNKQRAITGAFIVAVSFNLIGNLIFLPAYSYRAAAITTILSEAVLLAGFYFLLRQDIPGLNYFRALWRILLAAGLMGLGVWFGWGGLGMPLVLALMAGGGLYPLLLWALGPLTDDEQRRLGRYLPKRFRQEKDSHERFAH